LAVIRCSFMCLHGQPPSPLPVPLLRRPRHCRSPALCTSGSRPNAQPPPGSSATNLLLLGRCDTSTAPVGQ
jgi:hypothetical protein